MNNNIDTIKRLNFENIIWIVFIITSLLDIYGDELLKDSIINKDQTKENKAKKIFLFIIIISIIIYLYFLKRNYYDYKKYKTNNYEIRLLGSIFILTGTICLLYFQLNDKNETDSISIL